MKTGNAWQKEAYVRIFSLLSCKGWQFEYLDRLCVRIMIYYKQLEKLLSGRCYNAEYKFRDYAEGNGGL